MISSKFSVKVRNVEGVLLSLFSLYLGIRWLGLLNSNSMIIDALVSSSFLTAILMFEFGNEMKGGLIKDGLKFSISIMLLLILTLMGLSFFTGISLNPYTSTTSYMINNLIFIVPRTLALIAAIALTAKIFRLRNSLIASILIILSMNVTLSAILNSNVLTLQNIIEVIGPSVLEAIAIVLISKRFGIVPALAYGLVLSGSVWLNPLVPNVRGEFLGLIYIIVNLLTITYVTSPDTIFYGLRSKIDFKEGVFPIMITGLLVIAVLILMKNGYYMLLVLTGSMKPHINPGDIVFIGPGQTKVGEIIAYVGPGRSVILHRVIDIIQNSGHMSIITKGDANSVADPPFPPSHVLGRLIFKIPYVGLPILEIAKITGNTIEVAALLLGAIFFAYMVVSIRRKLKIL